MGLYYNATFSVTNCISPLRSMIDERWYRSYSEDADLCCIVFDFFIDGLAYAVVVGLVHGAGERRVSTAFATPYLVVLPFGSFCLSLSSITVRRGRSC